MPDENRTQTEEVSVQDEFEDAYDKNLTEIE